MKIRRIEDPQDHRAQHPQQEGLATTQLLDLADGVLGVLWRKLDRASRIALRRTCRAMRDSPAINAQIKALTVELGSAPPHELVAAMRAFPRSPAALRQLALKGPGGALWPFMSRVLGNPAAVAMMGAVDALGTETSGELEWEEVWGGLATLCPRLRSLRLHHTRNSSLLPPRKPFALPLSGFGASLQQLELRLEMPGAELQAAVDAVGAGLPGLQLLRLEGRVRDNEGWQAMHGRLDLSPLAGLAGLRELAVMDMNIPLAGLAAVARGCGQLARLELGLLSGLAEEEVQGARAEAEAEAEVQGAEGQVGSRGINSGSGGESCWWPALKRAQLIAVRCQPGLAAALRLHRAPRLRHIDCAPAVLMLQDGSGPGQGPGAGAGQGAATGASSPQALREVCELLAARSRLQEGMLMVMDGRARPQPLGPFFASLAPLGPHVASLGLHATSHTKQLKAGNMRALAQSLPGLTRLVLSTQPPGPGPLAAGLLAEAVGAWPGLRHLVLSMRGLQPAEVAVAAACAQAQAARGLRSTPLQLEVGPGAWWCREDAEGVRAMMRAMMLGEGQPGSPPLMAELVIDEAWLLERPAEDGSGDDAEEQEQEGLWGEEQGWEEGQGLA